MNWIKDNLIMILGVAVLVFGIGWVLDHYIQRARYDRLDKQTIQLRADLGTAVQINKAEIKKLTDLQAAFNALVERNAYNARQAEEAGARIALLQASFAAELQANKALRDKLALENPDVQSYMDAGMPCELARSLWPEARYCEGNPVR